MQLLLWRVCFRFLIITNTCKYKFLILWVVVTKFSLMNSEKLSTLQLCSVRWWNANAYYAISLSEVLQKNKVDVVVGGTIHSPALQKARQFNLRTCELDLENFHPWRWIRNISILKNIVESLRINLINAHRPEDHFYSGILKRKMPQIPLIRSVSDVRPPKTNLVNKYLHLKYTDHFIFSCQANRDRYLRVWPQLKEKSTVIYSGIDTQYFQPNELHSMNRLRYNIPSDSLVFGIVSRLSPVKKHSLFLKAAALLSKLTSKVFFIISGEEVEIKTTQLQEFCEQSGIAERTLFLGKFDDVREVIRLIDVGVVCSSNSEAVSRITAEFLAMSRPVIATNINVLPEMITDGYDGFIVPSHSPDDLANRMNILVQNHQLLRTMQHNARKTAETRFSYQRLFQETLQTYRMVLSKVTNNTI